MQVADVRVKVETAERAAAMDQRVLRRMVDDHLEALKTALMLPVSSMVEVFPGLVRDLARDQGKDVELIIQGAEIQIDKRVLEELKDSLIHMLRNAIDHGIEKPELRAARNKPPRGKITLSFTPRDSRQMDIQLSDDGAGVDLDEVRRAAVKHGGVSQDTARQMDAAAAQMLIFQSGISTSRLITEVSGRGLGLAIVREKVEKLGGSVALDSQAGAGTTFRLQVPMTLTTFRGLVVRAGGQVFIVPIVNVEKALRVHPEAIRTVENRESVEHNGEILAVASLSDTLELSQHSRQASETDGEERSGYVHLVLLVSSDRRIALKVDEVVEEQQVLVKSLGRQLRRLRNISGAAVLASGQLAPVLHASDLVKSALRTILSVKMTVRGEDAAQARKSILVAEDSITSRILIKNILETAGYQVATAVDGLDAFTQARAAHFDLVVSDVDMPRLSGFELTAKIRGDKKMGALPVVLVTALESREDRERGIEAGADAYIVKSSFDQSNLLEVVSRLI
jgi:two-component system chemotaxis sensor kinase CheA